jgi:hypothetical protein
VVRAAGFTEFTIVSRLEIYAGARQQSSAAKFGTMGITFAARRLLPGESIEAPACDLGGAQRG